MRINQSAMLPAAVQGATSLSTATWFRPGAQVQGVIRQLYSQNEAELEIQGQSYRVQVQGELPRQGRITIQIEGANDQGVILARMIPHGKSSATSPVDTYLAKLGITQPSNELRQVVAIYGEQGGFPRSEEVQLIQQILHEDGELTSKMETLQVMAQKQLPITRQAYEAVDQVLHGEELGSLLHEVEERLQMELPREALTPEMLQKIGEAIASFPQESLTPQQLLQLIQQLKQYGAHQLLDQETWSLLHTLMMNQAYVHASESLTLALQELDTLIQTSQVNHIERGQVDPLLLRLLGKVEGELQSVTQSANQVVSEEQVLQLLPTLGQWEERLASWQEGRGVPDLQDWKGDLKQLQSLLGREGEGKQGLQTLQEALNRAILFQLMGKEEQAPAILQEAFQRLRTELTTLPTGMAPSQQAEPELLITGLKERMQSLHFAFRQFQLQLQHQVKQMTMLLQSGNQSKEGLLSMIDATIRQLDRQLLSHEFATFSTMELEKQLMKISSQLSSLRHEVIGGKTEQGLAQLQRIAQQVSRINWQPPQLQAERFIQEQQAQTKQLLGSNEQLRQALVQLQEQQTQLLGARDIHQIVRNLGLQQEVELARHLQQGSAREPLPDTLKGTLLTLLQQSEQGSQRMLDKLSLHLLGQQLLNKADPSAFQQTYQLQLPIWEQERWDTLKLHLRSHRGKGSVDWENCSIYFLLDQPKFGPTGIQLQVVNRQLTLTVQTDHPDAPTRIEEEFTTFQEHLAEIGYQVGSIAFEKFPLQEGPQSHEGEGTRWSEQQSVELRTKLQSKESSTPGYIGNSEVDIKI
ncbi:hypothetical protein [Rubeoparvulum massiliense]|uniref:hypothetical protein n=1 Tax=Rubeoparvulum massiliense TaxID=1631346 RepID=UPI00065DE81F|nr:hypothetical protein [Rubeoparvulum massiliense]